MNDIIRKAVELAEGFEICPVEGDVAEQVWVESCATYFLSEPHWEQAFLDALAAQIVRQVDAVENLELIIRRDVTQLIKNYSDAFEIEKIIAYSGGEGRTTNTLRTIVESGVLEND